MEDNPVRLPDDANGPPSAPDKRPFAGNLSKYARPALIVGTLIAIVCIALLIIIFFLDSFNAATYSMTGKSVQDATDEARDIRDTYTGARIGAIVGLVVFGVVAIASGVVLYLNRGTAPKEEYDDGEDVDFDDLAGQ
jgi:ABC-type Fe3+ transport system permease subunit